MAVKKKLKLKRRDRCFSSMGMRQSYSIVGVDVNVEVERRVVEELEGGMFQEVQANTNTEENVSRK